ncbi:hypothetical protein [uncultured Sulfitobacter sp.]|uniref:hypothetical protein n=1 Tax=uncultured Sulfitobacter sp. TaxID=191468 RepID=UPI00261F9BDE|nr:hypothetical protein [uncultured Sulfitobacter sp.]
MKARPLDQDTTYTALDKLQPYFPISLEQIAVLLGMTDEKILAHEIDTVFRRNWLADEVSANYYTRSNGEQDKGFHLSRIQTAMLIADLKVERFASGEVLHRRIASVLDKWPASPSRAVAVGPQMIHGTEVSKQFGKKHGTVRKAFKKAIEDRGRLPKDYEQPYSAQGRRTLYEYVMPYDVAKPEPHHEAHTMLGSAELNTK